MKGNNGGMRPTRRPLQTTRSRVVSATLAGAFIFAACGGGGGDSDSGGDSSSVSNATEEVAEVAATPDDVAVAPESDTETNVLPDVVLDNLTLNNKVNLRNVIPSDKVVLLWMWAPF